MNVETPLYEQFLYFIVCGAFLGLGYEILRLLRFCLPHGVIVTGIEDTLYLSLCGFILFGFSMEIGNGQFRLLYLVSAAVGAAVYFLTVGRLIKKLYTLILSAFSKIIRFIFRPVKKAIGKFAHFLGARFGKVYKLLSAKLKNRLNNLKSKHNMLYNHNDNTARGDEIIAGKQKIKAKVKKEQ
ncbi:MAG: spore cortex biosynthesis protein YabQ [Eubacterium sp.]|nr:spore cortex biosynthesis protein YabQ [Eubacterium sp.]